QSYWSTMELMLRPPTIMDERPFTGLLSGASVSLRKGWFKKAHLSMHKIVGE
ncbi:hypothetical protein ACKVWE_011495, partial [Pyricularia oryzae]